MKRLTASFFSSELCPVYSLLSAAPPMITTWKTLSKYLLMTNSKPLFTTIKENRMSSLTTLLLRVDMQVVMPSPRTPGAQRSEVEIQPVFCWPRLRPGSWLYLPAGGIVLNPNRAPFCLLSRQPLRLCVGGAPIL